jgi:ATP-dependent helicase/nuclease subunit A
MKLGGERPVPLVRPRADERVAPFAAMMDEQKALDLEEHWRLLYVGLTRAKEYLVVAGLAPKGKPVDNSWHSLTQRAMIRLGASACPTGAGEGLCWEGRVPARPARLRKGRTPLVPLQRPDWLDRAAPEEERPPRPLAPSSLGDDQQGASPPSPAQRAAARRGSLLHSLFERLPGVAPEDRARLADRWLARAAVTEPVERGEIIAAALGVIEHPRFAALFSSAALAEAPIAATLADGRVIAGTVDRLLVEPDRILVVDFKTGRNVPGGLAEVPTHHAAQMAAYAAALRIIFPGRKVEAALLYSHGPSLIALDG